MVIWAVVLGIVVVTLVLDVIDVIRWPRPSWFRWRR